MAFEGLQSEINVLETVR